MFYIIFFVPLTISQITYSSNPYTLFHTPANQIISPNFETLNSENPSNTWLQRIYIPGVFQPINNVNPRLYFKNEGQNDTAAISNNTWSETEPTKYIIFSNPTGIAIKNSPISNNIQNDEDNQGNRNVLTIDENSLDSELKILNQESDNQNSSNIDIDNSVIPPSSLLTNKSQLHVDTSNHCCRGNSLSTLYYYIDPCQRSKPVKPIENTSVTKPTLDFDNVQNGKLLLESSMLPYHQKSTKLEDIDSSLIFPTFISDPLNYNKEDNYDNSNGSGELESTYKNTNSEPKTIYSQNLFSPIQKLNYIPNSQNLLDDIKSISNTPKNDETLSTPSFVPSNPIFYHNKEPDTSYNPGKLNLDTFPYVTYKTSFNNWQNTDFNRQNLNNMNDYFKNSLDMNSGSEKSYSPVTDTSKDKCKCSNSEIISLDMNQPLCNGCRPSVPSAPGNNYAKVSGSNYGRIYSSQNNNFNQNMVFNRKLPITGNIYYNSQGYRTVPYGQEHYTPLFRKQHNLGNRVMYI